MELLALTKFNDASSFCTKGLLLIVTLFVLSPVAKTCADPSESKYFEVVLSDGVSLEAFYSVVRRDSFTLEEIITPLAPANLEQLALSALDSFYLDVAGILDMQPQGFKTRIEVYPDQAQIIKVKQLFNVQSHSDAVVYVFMQDTLLISMDGLSPALLGHEIAQAIISHYFVVPPPKKVVEVLTSYVDRQLAQEALQTGIKAEHQK